ncbi:MAG: hypothetical protein R3300_17940 [Candidatus Promineifilaceae bacterium]|nr:hypothetical protein [Candidatus Promineifilaceae bacterium]
MMSLIALHRPIVVSRRSVRAQWRWAAAAGVVMGVWLSMMLYIDTLNVPFFQDDVAHIRWLAGLDSPLEPFITAAGLPAYRPLGEMLLKVWYLLLGQHNATWLRFLNISMHSLNVALVAGLAWRLDRSRQRAVTAAIAALLFATLPFAYQAIPWVNVFFYPLNNLLQLLMLLFYWSGRVRGSGRLLAVGLFFAFLSPFEIEYGLVNGGLLLGAEIALWLQGRQRRIWLGGPLIALALNLVFLVMWLVVPKNAYAFGPPTAERVGQIFIYLLQGLIYPVAPLALPLMENTRLNDLGAIALVALPALLGLIWLLAGARRRALLVLSLLWFWLLQLPGLITLPFDYYINSPRLLYPTGPAVAWLWGAGLAAVALRAGRVRRLRLVGVTVALMAVLAMSVAFVRVRLDHYQIVTPSVTDLATAAAQAPPGERLLVVNMPAWIAPPQRTFALGNNGIQWIPFYVGIEDVIFAANDRDQPATAVQFPSLRQPQPYAYGMHGLAVDWEGLRRELLLADQVYLTRYQPERINLLPAGHVDQQAWLDDAYLSQALFGGQVDVGLQRVETDSATIDLTLHWRMRQALPQDVTVFVHLYGPDGSLIDQHDGYPLRGLAPFWLWEESRLLVDRRRLTWPVDAPAGQYSIGIGLYHRASGLRLAAVGPDGLALPDDILLAAIVERP